MSNEELWAAGKLPELWEAVKRLLYQMAWKFRFSHEETGLEYLRLECYFSFLNAVKAYKPEKGVTTLSTPIFPTPLKAIFRPVEAIGALQA